jgi:hypothetical protein
VNEQLFALISEITKEGITRGEAIRCCFRRYYRLKDKNPVVISDINELNTSGKHVLKFEAPDYIVPEDHKLQRMILGLRFKEVKDQIDKIKKSELDIPPEDKKYQGIAEMAKM